MTLLRTAFAAALVLAACRIPLFAAQPPAPASVQQTSPYPEPAARVVQIDAVVTDRSGKPILDLKPADFELVEDGVVQRLNAVELRRHASAAEARQVETTEDEERAAREPGTRVFALLLDEFHISAGASTELVRESVTRFLDEQVRASDLVAVLKPLDPVTRIRFTRGAEEARRAAASFTGRKDNYEARTEFEQRYIGSAPAAVRSARAQIVFSGLRALTMRLGELGAGRAAIVLVTEGFSRPGGRDGDLQAIVRAASRARAAVYTLDPAAPVSGSELDRPRAFMQALAAQTGGEYGAGGPALSPALQKVAADLDGYYLLSYTSSHSSAGRFYDVQVRARRANATVRTRSGYWAPVRTDLLLGSERRPSAPARVIRRSPLIETWLGLTMADGIQYVTLTWTPVRPRGRPAAIGTPGSVSLRVTTREGAVLFEGEISAVKSGPIAGREEAARFEALPGTIQIDLAVHAADGTQLDTAAQDVNVPDLSRADPVILPPQVFRAASAREFRTFSADPYAAPVPEREFRRTDRLLVRVPTHSPSGARVALALRLVNRTGQVLRTLEAMPRTANQTADQFDLPLAALAPGDYAIQMTGTTPTGSEASEVIRFRVTG